MLKRIIILFIVVVAGTKATAQINNNIEDGYHVFNYPNGSKASEGYIRNGKPDGFWRSYYITGVKKSEGKYTNFMLDSIWVFFDQVGDTTDKINYLYGKKNGYYYRYEKDPSVGLYIWSKELYAGDRKEGTAYIYFPDGKIKQTFTYNAGKKEGLSKEYDQNGNIITLYEYNNDFLISRERINRRGEEGLKQGEWKEFYPEGTIRKEMTYRDDRLHGYYKEYDKRGMLVLTMLYDNGAIVKSEVEDEPDIEIVNRYDSTGRLTYNGPYRNDVPVGIHREYGEQGQVINAFIYNDNGLLLSEGIVDESGNQNGKWKDYYPDGKIKAEGVYNNNRRSGMWKFYNNSSGVEQTGSYNNGRPDGLWQWYYNDGSILREEEYFQGFRDGSYTEYDRDGSIIVTGQYTDGEKNGQWKYTSGDYIEEGKYIIGLKDGQWKAYYSDGTLKFRGSYVQGNPHQKHFYYYESGRVKEEQYYQMGIRQRTWKKYDEEGNTILTITYKDDVERSINGVKIDLPERDVKLIQ